MAEVDAQRVIDKLGLKLANSEVKNAILEARLEDANTQLAAAHQELADLRTEHIRSTEAVN